MYLSEREMGFLGFAFCTIYGCVAPTPPRLMAPLTNLELKITKTILVFILFYPFFIDELY